MAAGADDELRACAIPDDRLGRGDGLGVDELEGRVARDGLDDAATLEGKLLAVRQADDRAPSAPLRVIAGDSFVLVGGAGRIGRPGHSCEGRV